MRQKTGPSGLTAALLLAVAVSAWAQTYDVVVVNPDARTYIRSSRFTAFTVNTDFPGGVGACVADVDQDGDPDIVGASRTADRVCWWENTGGGANWRQHTLDPATDGASAVAVADIDGDGDPDVAAAAFDAGSIVWWENATGNASNWIKRTVTGAFQGASSLAVADMDGDGHPDILATALTAHTVAWWRNVDGTGALWVRRTVDGSFAGASSVAAADVDGDGDLDVIAASMGGDEIAWWENVDGQGMSWTRRAIATTVDGVSSLAIADLDGDGDPDVVASAFNADAVAWWENRTAQGEPWARHTVADDFEGASGVAVADLDGDGDPDAIGTAFGGDAVVWWENADGHGRQWLTHPVSAGVNGAAFAAAPDLNTDGKPDLLALAYVSGDVLWWRNDIETMAECFPPVWTNSVGASSLLTVYLTNGVAWGNALTQYACTAWARTGSAPAHGRGYVSDEFTLTNPAAIVFTWTTQYWLQASAGPNGRVVATNGWYDTGATGTLQAIPQPLGRFAGWSGELPPEQTNDNPLVLNMNRSYSLAANFILPEHTLTVSNAWSATLLLHPSVGFTSHAVDWDFGGARSAVGADLDGDGDTDVLAASLTDHTIAWWENLDGDGVRWLRRPVITAFGGARATHAADMDGDGDLDVIGVAYDADRIAWWENTAGDGSVWTEHIVTAAFEGAYDVEAVDLDGDGDVDILAAAYIADDVAWWENTDGSGLNWTKRFIDPAFDGARCAVAADIDGDGDLDVLGAAFAADEIAWWENVGGRGTNWIFHSVAVGVDGVSCVRAVDVDGDGRLDIAASVWNDGHVAWWRNVDGRGTQWVKRLVDANVPGASAIHAADVDLDGFPDLLAASYEDHAVLWWQNVDGTGTNWLRRALDGKVNLALSVTTADLNGDGSPDVLSAGSGGSVASWENHAQRVALFDPPSGTQSLPAATNLSARSLVSPVWRSASTQVVVTGWTRTGSDDGSGPGRNTDSFALTNSATIVFAWSTQYWLQVSSSAHGRVEARDGWHTDGTSVTITAIPDPVACFCEWSGDVPDALIHENPLNLPMDRPRTIRANFVLPEYRVVVSNRYATTFIREYRQSPIRFDYRPVDTAFFGAASVRAADLDSDGSLDLVGAAYFDGDVAWWRNADGQGGMWTRYTVDPDFVGAYAIDTGDVNGDGREDILAVSPYTHTVAWWENRSAAGTNWTQRIVDAAFSGASAVHAADIDGDGDLDLLGAATTAGVLAWWDNQNGAGTSWLKQPVATNFHGAGAVTAADLDGDGRLDIIGAAPDQGIVWWRNADGSGVTWLRQPIAAPLAGATAVAAADMDGDGDMDVIGAGAEANLIAWWENADGSGSNWLVHPIATGFTGARSVAVADIDLDGDLDVIGAALTADTIAWWERLDDTGVNWRLHTVDTAFNSAISVVAADLDADGDADIVAAAGAGDRIAWWANDLTFAAFPSPAWTNVMTASTNLTAYLSQSVLWGNIATQFAVTGWTRTGSDPAAGTSSDTGPFVLTNDMTLVFDWATQYWLSASADLHGQVLGDPSGWYAVGSTVTVTAAPAAYYTFSAWTGGVESADNPLTITQRQAVSLWATFTAALATNSVPWWWLAGYGWTNRFDEAALDDPDEDGALTWEEYIAGTVPTNALSVFAILHVEPLWAQEASVIRWSSESNRFYAVETTTNLMDAFIPVTNDIPATPPENVYTNAPDTVPARVYRLRVRWP